MCVVYGEIYFTVKQYCIYSQIRVQCNNTRMYYITFKLDIFIIKICVIMINEWGQLHTERTGESENGTEHYYSTKKKNKAGTYFIEISRLTYTCSGCWSWALKSVTFCLNQQPCDYKHTPGLPHFQIWDVDKLKSKAEKTVQKIYHAKGEFKRRNTTRCEVYESYNLI